jgi:hypothetical protein
MGARTPALHAADGCLLDTHWLFLLLLSCLVRCNIMALPEALVLRIMRQAAPVWLPYRGTILCYLQPCCSLLLLLLLL